jgi:hypothetical protein
MIKYIERSSKRLYNGNYIWDKIDKKKKNFNTDIISLGVNYIKFSFQISKLPFLPT